MCLLSHVLKFLVVLALAAYPTASVGGSVLLLGAGGPPAASGGLISCTGGTQTSDGAGNLVAKFTASGTLTCSGPIPAAQILAVGGGGGGSGGGGGGGSAAGGTGGTGIVIVSCPTSVCSAL